MPLLVVNLETKPVVDLFIGYGGVVVRPVVKEQANVYITSDSLASLLPILLDQDELLQLSSPAIV